MGTAVVIVLLVLATVALLAARRRASAKRRGVLGLAAATSAVLSVLVIAFSCFTIVPTRQVGVPVTFGKPGTPLKNGLHPKAPWTEVVLMDATIQSLDASGENPTVAKDVDRADVFVHNNVRWSIKEESADELYIEFRDFDNVNSALIQPQLRTAVATVMADYNPLAQDAEGLDSLAAEVETELQEAVGSRVVIHSVSITLLDFAEATKNRINALNTERGNTRIAEQRKATAKANAEANRILADSVSDDPNVLVAKCLDLLAEGKSLPAGFQCWPGASGGQGVIVDGTTKAPATSE